MPRAKKSETSANPTPRAKKTAAPSTAAKNGHENGHEESSHQARQQEREFGGRRHRRVERGRARRSRGERRRRRLRARRRRRHRAGRARRSGARRRRDRLRRRKPRSSKGSTRPTAKTARRVRSEPPPSAPPLPKTAAARSPGSTRWPRTCARCSDTRSSRRSRPTTSRVQFVGSQSPALAAQARHLEPAPGGEDRLRVPPAPTRTSWTWCRRATSASCRRSSATTRTAT